MNQLYIYIQSFLKNIIFPYYITECLFLFLLYLWIDSKFVPFWLFLILQQSETLLDQLSEGGSFLGEAMVLFQASRNPPCFTVIFLTEARVWDLFTFSLISLKLVLAGLFIVNCFAFHLVSLTDCFQQMSFCGIVYPSRLVSWCHSVLRTLSLTVCEPCSHYIKERFFLVLFFFSGYVISFGKLCSASFVTTNNLLVSS